MATYILGPFLSLLPKRLRCALAFLRINWTRATMVSGFVQFWVFLAAFLKWYAVTMTLWVNRGLQVAETGQAGPNVTDHAIGAAALMIWASEPLTWVLGYFTFEGAVRFFGAAFAGNVLGTLPLFLVGKLFGLFLPEPKTAEDVPAGSFFSAVGEKILEAGRSDGPDQVIVRRSASEEILEIRASRKKQDWDPPRVVRINNNYYRLESCSKVAPPRPFHYMLRRLAAGVPGRSVLLYEFDESR